MNKIKINNIEISVEEFKRLVKENEALYSDYTDDFFVKIVASMIYVGIIALPLIIVLSAVKWIFFY